MKHLTGNRASKPSSRIPEEDRASGGGGNVLLATFGVPFDVRASNFAVDAAVESGCCLIIANFVELERTPLSNILGYGTVEYPPELADSLLAPAALAASLGVKVERIRVRSLRRVESLVEVARERNVKLLVLGPDHRRVGHRLFRKAETAVRERLNCLVWVNPDISAA